MTKDFKEYLFKGLNVSQFSNKYLTCNRHNDDFTKVVIKVADVHLLKTKYGYAYILDRTHVVFLKDWAVNRNWFGNEVIFDKQYFMIREWGEHEDFSDMPEALNWEYFVEIAKQQANPENPVKWEA